MQTDPLHSSNGDQVMTEGEPADNAEEEEITVMEEVCNAPKKKPDEDDDPMPPANGSKPASS